MNTPEGQKLAELLMQYGCALKMHDAKHVAGKILELLQFDTLTQELERVKKERDEATGLVTKFEAELAGTASGSTFDFIHRLQSRCEQLEARWKAAEEVLQGRCDNIVTNPVHYACEQYIAAEDSLPDCFDTEDYCLSRAVESLVKQSEQCEQLEATCRELTVDGNAITLAKTVAQLEAKCAEMRNALRELKVRIAYIGMPQEPMWAIEDGPSKGRTVPDWRKWIAILEHALHSPDCGKGMVNVRELDKTIELIRDAQMFIESYFIDWERMNNEPKYQPDFPEITKRLSDDKARLEALQKGRQV